MRYSRLKYIPVNPLLSETVRFSLQRTDLYHQDFSEFSSDSLSNSVAFMRQEHLFQVKQLPSIPFKTTTATAWQDGIQGDDNASLLRVTIEIDGERRA